MASVPGLAGGAHIPSSLSAAHAPVGRVDANRERAVARSHEHDFHTRDVGQFSGREMGLWRAGGWHREMHYGRYGWWWWANDVWYPYPEPVYPYPLFVAEIDELLAVPAMDIEANGQ
jgi:hypothetical protein